MLATAIVALVALAPLETVAPETTEAVPAAVDAPVGTDAPASTDAPATETNADSSPPLASAPSADSSVVAPAPPAAIAPSSVVDRPTSPRNDAVDAFTARRGYRMVTAGTAVAAAGVAWLGIAGWMLAADDPRLGLSLAFTINGAVATTVGLGVAIGGSQRARHPATWLAKRPDRRARMEVAARGFDPHTPTTAAERGVVAKGMKLRNYGFISLTAGIGLVAFGTGMQFAYGGDSLALKIVVPAVSVPFVIAGGVLLGAGGRRIYSPQRFADRHHASSPRRPRVQLAAAPSFQRGSYGIALSGKF